MTASSGMAARLSPALPESTLVFPVVFIPALLMWLHTEDSEVAFACSYNNSCCKLCICPGMEYPHLPHVFVCIFDCILMY